MEFLQVQHTWDGAEHVQNPHALTRITPAPASMQHAWTFLRAWNTQDSTCACAPLKTCMLWEGNHWCLKITLLATT
eukprot:1154939-Pelagomonas_calceolata.AAC.1